MGNMNYVIVLACLSLMICLVQSSQNVEMEEIRAKAFLEKLNNEIRERYSKYWIGEWNYVTNVTAENGEQKNAIAAENAKYYKEKSKEILEFDFNAFKNDDLKRQFKLLSRLGYAALPADKFNLLNSAWYDLAGTATRKDFETYLQLNKEAANLNNFTSGAEMWLNDYEDDTLEVQLENIFEEIRPFYLQLHAYVRHSLKQTYGEEISEDGPIPMHLLGNMWAQSWENIYDQTTPYPKKQSEGLTKEMLAQNYTALKMFKLAEKFYVSLNMSALP
ncbi:angiotensin-converting enzyme-like, partial [Contarinia nasturtii]|uniref:angiotensin-converting enzyme-like n=1 Tax=Contarinia nasturtii TaxID=265458 RepID=UPI0012D3D0C2